MRPGESCARSIPAGRGTLLQRPLDTTNFEGSDFSPPSGILTAILPIRGFAAKVALAGAIHKHAQEFSRGNGTTNLRGKLRTPAGSSFAHDTTFADRSIIDPL